MPSEGDAHIPGSGCGLLYEAPQLLPSHARSPAAVQTPPVGVGPGCATAAAAAAQAMSVDKSNRATRIEDLRKVLGDSRSNVSAAATQRQMRTTCVHVVPVQYASLRLS